MTLRTRHLHAAHLNGPLQQLPLLGRPFLRESQVAAMTATQAVLADCVLGRLMGGARSRQLSAVYDALRQLAGVPTASLQAHAHEIVQHLAPTLAALDRFSHRGRPAHLRDKARDLGHLALSILRRADPSFQSPFHAALASDARVAALPTAALPLPTKGATVTALAPSPPPGKTTARHGHDVPVRREHVRMSAAQGEAFYRYLKQQYPDSIYRHAISLMAKSDRPLRVKQLHTRIGTVVMSSSLVFGSFGEVKFALLGEECLALKMLRIAEDRRFFRKKDSQNKRAQTKRQQMQRELDMCRRAQSRLTVENLGQTRGKTYLKMTWMPGDLFDAHEHLKKKPSYRVINHILRQLAGDLHHCHRAGVVHRDVKLQNAFVREDGSVLLGDYGLAMAADELHDCAGSRHFAPRDVRSGKAKHDAGADYYALVLTLLEFAMAAAVPVYRADFPIWWDGLPRDAAGNLDIEAFMGRAATGAYTNFFQQAYKRHPELTVFAMTRGLNPVASQRATMQHMTNFVESLTTHAQHDA